MELKDCRKLILSGEIKTFDDLLKHVSIEQVAEGMGCGVKQVQAVRREPGKMRVGELIRLSEAIGVHRDRVMGLFVS